MEDKFNLEHSPTEMTLQNLIKIQKCIECMLDICRNNPDSQDIIINHAWMVDHVSTSADDLQEACDFLCSRLEEPNNTRMMEMDPMTMSGLAKTFESYISESFPWGSLSSLSSMGSRRRRSGSDYESRRNRRPIESDSNRNQPTDEDGNIITLHDISKAKFGCEFWELDDDRKKRWCLDEYGKLNDRD